MRYDSMNTVGVYVQPVPMNTESTTSKKSKLFKTSFRTMAFLFGILAFLIFLTNVAFLLSMTKKSPGADRMDSGVREIHNGSKESVRTYSVLLHLCVNVLSTALLGASNYCQQCLSSPTRKDIDDSHARNRYLDIGIPSIRNLRVLPFRFHRHMLVVLLMGTSLVLHLLYNSTIFETTTAYYYNVAIVNERFFTTTTERTTFPSIVSSATLTGLSKDEFDVIGDEDFDIDSSGSIFGNDKIARWDNTLRIFARASKNWERLSPKACYEKYTENENFLTDRSNVLLVTRTAAPQAYGSSTVYLATSINPIAKEGNLAWAGKLYSNQQTGGAVVSISYGEGISFSLNKEMFSVEIDYCLSERANEGHRLQYSRTILILVALANLTKCICMFWTSIRGTTSRQEPLVTVGDAICSFLDHEDVTTRGLCAASQHDLRSEGWYNKARPQLLLQARRYDHSASRKRWIVTIILWLLIIHGLFATLLAFPRDVWTLTIDISKWGANKLSAKTFTSISSNTDIGDVIAANTPQSLLSMGYLFYNAIITAMFTNREYTAFSSHPHALRVSRPTGQQKGTYNLQLPYRIIVPLLTVFSIMHWVISETIYPLSVHIVTTPGTYFNVDDFSVFNLKSDELQIDVKYTDFDFNDNYLDGKGNIIVASFSTYGFSPPGAIITALVCIILLVSVICVGKFKRFKGGMPVGATNTAVLSAACHPGMNGADPTGILKWGDISSEMDQVGHLSFVSNNGYVKEIQTNRYYM